jgi:hypothetical protein
MKAVAESIPNCTAIEQDALKRMIDPKQSSGWRREMALRTTCRMASDLLGIQRNVAVEAHSRWQNQTDRLSVVAWRHPGSKFFSFLVTAPLEICQQRASDRDVPDISYAIDREMVEAHYTNLEPRPNETVIDTSQLDTLAASRIILEKVLHCNED